MNRTVDNKIQLIQFIIGILFLLPICILFILSHFTLDIKLLAIFSCGVGIFIFAMLFIKFKNMISRSSSNPLEKVLTSIDETKTEPRVNIKLYRINRALRVLSDCNHAVLRAKNEISLFKEVCRRIVDDGAYRMAWIGIKDDSELDSIKPVALSGLDESYLRNPEFIYWCAALREEESALTISLPLNASSQVIGVLKIYAGEKDSFIAEEVKLLKDLASDLAYGADQMRKSGGKWK